MTYSVFRLLQKTPVTLIQVSCTYSPLTRARHNRWLCTTCHHLFSLTEERGDKGEELVPQIISKICEISIFFPSKDFFLLSSKGEHRYCHFKNLLKWKAVWHEKPYGLMSLKSLKTLFSPCLLLRCMRRILTLILTFCSFLHFPDWLINVRQNSYFQSRSALSSYETWLG